MKYHHKESDLQIRCVRYFRTQYPEFACLLFHPRNEGSGHSVEDRKRQSTAKKEGVQAGVADLMLQLPAEYREPGVSWYDVTHYHSIAFETKTKSGRQSPEQKLWQRYYEASGGKYILFRDFETFQTEVDEYMANVPVAVKNRILDLHHDIETEKTEQAKRELQRIIEK